MTAWELFTRCANTGAHVSYLDIDQLGMLYPESEGDPEGSGLKRDALTAIRHNYSQGGRSFLAVSGVLDPAYLVSQAHTCLLTVHPETLRARILERGWTSEDADEAAAEQEELVAAGFADDVVETTGLPLAQVAERVHASFSRRSWLPSPDYSARPRYPASRASSVLINGPRGVGCSTVSFMLAQRRWRSAEPTGFLDLEQLAIASTPGRREHRDLGLGLANVATLSDVFADRGARGVIVNGHLATAEELRRIRSGTGTTVVRLRADSRTIAEHLLERRGGSDARLAGDDLADASDDHRAAILSLALEQQQRLDVLHDEDLLLGVSGRTVEDVVDEIEARLASR